jgi:hypothetical protein
MHQFSIHRVEKRTIVAGKNKKNKKKKKTNEKYFLPVLSQQRLCVSHNQISNKRNHAFQRHRICHVNINVTTRVILLCHIPSARRENLFIKQFINIQTTTKATLNLFRKPSTAFPPSVFAILVREFLCDN